MVHTPAMTSRARTAFIDESFRRGPGDHGYYFLGAVIVPDAHIVELTGRLRAHLPSGMRRWHWREEGAGSRRRFTALVAEFAAPGVEAVVCCQVTASQRKGEQARVRCLWELLAVLRHGQVGTAVFESRQEHNDRKDRREVISAQQAGVAAKGLIYRHGRPREEPMLWVADAIVGAVGMEVASGQGQFAALLPETWSKVRWVAAP